MYWSFTHNNQKYYTWGQPRALSKDQVLDLKPDFTVPIYSGTPIKSGESVLFTMQGDATLGMGDMIWLISFMRDIYRIKSRRRSEFYFSSSPIIQEFCKNFLPKAFHMEDEMVPIDRFSKYQHYLPALYYWKDESIADKSWVDNKSILERMYDWTGMEYDSLPDFGEFTNEAVLYPPAEYYTKLGIDKKDKYVFFQWHSSGHAKNLPPTSNLQLIKHLLKQYGYKVYIIGKLNCLDDLEKIEGVKNLSNKTTGLDVFSLAFNSEFIVSPDSAGIHLGEAYRIPTVGILSTLPPVYIASKYKIPSFMFGSGICAHRPCGVVHALPRDRCPPDTKNYCKVLEKIDLNLFDKCVAQSIENRTNYKSRPNREFYNALSEPISL